MGIVCKQRTPRRTPGSGKNPVVALPRIGRRRRRSVVARKRIGRECKLRRSTFARAFGCGRTLAPHRRDHVVGAKRRRVLERIVHRHQSVVRGGIEHPRDRRIDRQLDRTSFKAKTANHRGRSDRANRARVAGFVRRIRCQRIVARHDNRGCPRAGSDSQPLELGRQQCRIAMHARNIRVHSIGERANDRAAARMIVRQLLRHVAAVAQQS